MDIYHIWCDAKPGVKDLDFANAFNAYMRHLKQKGAIEAWRLTRRKLGFGPRELGDYHIMIETENLAQLDAAFALAAERSEPTERVHHGINTLATNLTFALTRDFPDENRRTGEERF